MKKTLLIFGSCLVLFSSCFTYTCPTYSKQSDKRQEKQQLEQRIENYQ